MRHQRVPAATSRPRQHLAPTAPAPFARPSQPQRLCASLPLLLLLQAGGGEGRGRPRLLACHDMAGGYGDDRFCQGGSHADFYCLRRWHSLDAFCYFSHRLVTIPPPGWINAAHAHGVPVLGTVITEWEAGAAACTRLFGSPAAAEAAAARLAAIARHYGFEGWLVNIENAVERQHIPHLLHFLRCVRILTRLPCAMPSSPMAAPTPSHACASCRVLTHQMRQVAPGRSQVVW